MTPDATPLAEPALEPMSTSAMSRIAFAAFLLVGIGGLALAIKCLVDARSLPFPDSRLRRLALGGTWMAGSLAALGLARLARRRCVGDAAARWRAFRACFVAMALGGVALFAVWPAIGSMPEDAPFWKAGAFATVLLAPLALPFAFGVRWAFAGWRGRASRLADAILFNAALLFVCLELGLRAIGLFSNSPLFLPRGAKKVEALQFIDTWRLKPDAKFEGWFPNSRGYYDDEFVVPKPLNTFRIVALADSFGRGSVPKPFNFLTLLEEELAGWPDDATRVDVCNLGINGIGPEHYLALLESEAPALQPDLVLLCFFVGNDFADDPVGEAFASRWEAFYCHRVGSRLVRAWRSMAAARQAAAANAGAEGDPTPPHVLDWRLEPPGLPFDYYWKVQKDRTRFFDPSRDDAMFQRAIGVVGKIRERAETLTGRPLVVLIIPDEMQVDPEIRAKLEAEVCFALEQEKPQRALHVALAGDGYLVLDPLDALRAAHAELGRVYHLQDTHWNANGNRVVAEFVARALRDAGERLAGSGK